MATPLSIDRMKFLEVRLDVLLHSAKNIGFNTEEANDIADAFYELVHASPFLKALDSPPRGLERLAKLFRA